MAGKPGWSSWAWGRVALALHIMIPNRSKDDPEVAITFKGIPLMAHFYQLAPHFKVFKHPNISPPVGEKALKLKRKIPVGPLGNVSDLNHNLWQ